MPLVKLVDKGELQQFNDQRLKEIRSYAIGLGPDYTDLTEQNTHHLKDLGFIVHPYTVNEKADMLRLNKYAVHCVFTNFAHKYKKSLSSIVKLEKNKYKNIAITIKTAGTDFQIEIILLLSF